MLNLLFHQIQNQLADSVIVLRFVAMIVAWVVLVYSGHATYRERGGESWRRMTYAIGTVIGAYTAVAYSIVLFIEPTSAPAWLPLAIIGWMVHYLVVMRVMDTVITTSPSEQATAEIKRLGYELANRAQDNENARGTNKILIEQIRETEAEKVQCEKALESARAKLVEMLEETTELRSIIDRLRARGRD